MSAIARVPGLLLDPVANQLAQFMSANQVTSLRSFIIMPVVLTALMLDLPWPITMALYVVCWALDNVDGRVAQIERNHGKERDEPFGAFYDAFCDKLKVFLFILVVALHYFFQTDSWSNWATGTYLLLLSVFVTELALAGIRVRDYRFVRQRAAGSRDLRSMWAGKVKMALQAIGLGGFIVACGDIHHWAITFAFVVLVLSWPFGAISLWHKLKQAR